MSEPLVFIYADESCLGNQFKGRARPGGAAGVVEYWHPQKGWIRRDFWTSEPDTTNNRMAIRSAIEGLNALKKPCQVVFVSDSQYLVRGAGEWMYGWARAGWKRKAGALENVELWQQLYETARRHDINWKWVRGHAGHPQNEYANFLATRAAKEQTSSNGLIDSGFGEWLAQQREKYDRYLMFDETAAVEAETS